MSNASTGRIIHIWLPADFLEQFPLYKAHPLPDLKRLQSIANIGYPALTMECQNCSSDQTFLPVNTPSEGFAHPANPVHGEVLRCHFACGRCRLYRRQFFVHFDCEKSVISKVGQFPAWDIRGDRRVEKLLGDRRLFWRRALICESQGYGIGAFSYYRRIVELIIDDIIRDLRDSIPPAALPHYEEALIQVENEHRASEKIAIAKDMLPSSLRPAGMNPLGRLYETLSEGIHSYQDEECLVLAQQVRTILTYLVREIEGAKEQKREFTETMQKLLNKKQ